MSVEKSAITVISLGGSVIVPNTPDVSAITSFLSLIKKRIEQKERFIIVVGGGGIARTYQKALQDLLIIDHHALDTIGVSATRFNAELVRLAFGELAHSRVLSDITDIPEWKDAPVLIASGYVPGSSTDLCAVRFACATEASRVLNLSNTSQVYSADPKRDASAKPLTHLSWDEYLSLIPTEWSPGLSTPFDPVASRLAKEKNIRVYIMHGGTTDNTELFFNGGEYVGTCIGNNM